MTKPKRKFYACDICGAWHPAEWNGDCRDDANRFSTYDLDDKYGPWPDGWEIVSQPRTEDGEPT